MTEVKDCIPGYELLERITKEDREAMTCKHTWKNDPMFEDGAVEMFTSMQGEEMRQFCTVCGKIRYVPKNVEFEKY